MTSTRSHDKGGWIPADWQKRLPHNSCALHLDHRVPGAQGQSEGHQGLGRPDQAGRQVITPNPKTSGGARWNYLAAWEYAQAQVRRRAKAKDFVQALYDNVPVLDTGARGSSITFAQRNQGDVFISWENEAYLLEKEFGGKVDIVYPSLSILAEPPVTVVDKNVDNKGTRAWPRLTWSTCTPTKARTLPARTSTAPMPRGQAKYAKQFPKIKLFTIDDAFGGWTKAAKDTLPTAASSTRSTPARRILPALYFIRICKCDFIRSPGCWPLLACTPAAILDHHALLSSFARPARAAARHAGVGADLPRWLRPADDAERQLRRVARVVQGLQHRPSAAQWKKNSGADVRVNQTHGGSGKQARAVIDGLEADVITMTSAPDIDILRARRLVPPDWPSACPTTARRTPRVVFLVRKGNPKRHQGLGRPGQARVFSHHAEPEDLRRRPLELPGGLGCGASSRRTRAQAPRRRC